jgi:hypothetical protein
VAAINTLVLTSSKAVVTSLVAF